MEEAVGSWAIYYEPRRNSGRQAYFAMVGVKAVQPDREHRDHYYAYLENYLDFDRPVPFRDGRRTFESALVKDDGTANAGSFGWSVRRIPNSEFEQILASGFAPVLHPTSEWQQSDKLVLGVSEDTSEWNPRPLVEQISMRPFRDAAFSHRVREAYDNTCAISGLKLVNGGGRPEVQAAHIRPVASGGPDYARNGLALSSTVHWMFDRGLISVSEDLRLLIAEGEVAQRTGGLLRAGQKLLVPRDPSAHPHPEFLNFHRTNVFKG